MQPAGPRLVLRLIPEVAEIGRAMNLKNALWAKENDDLGKRVDALARALFGVTSDETYRDDEDIDLAEHEAWESQFDPVFLTWPGGKPFWDAVGIDVTDGQDDELTCIGSRWNADWPGIGRPLLAAVRGLCGANLPVDQADALQRARGSTLPRVSLDDWAERLAADAKRFKRGA